MPDPVVCVDANIVVSLVTSEVQSRKALALWTEWMERDYKVVAPALLGYEVASALRRKVARGSLSREDAKRSLETALSLDLELVDPGQHLLQALDLAAELQRPSLHDAAYLALAKILQCEFWTADESLYSAIKPGFRLIRCIRD